MSTSIPPPHKLAAVTQAWSDLIDALGYDPKDPHLVESPARVARFLCEWHTRDGKPPPKLTCFPNDDPKIDEVVATGRMRFYSMCAHHGLPFFGEAAIGYIPRDKVLGLSKFARVVRHFAQRFQTQERLTHEIVTYLEKEHEPVGIGVVMSAEHLCMSMRGVCCPDHETVTSAMRGAFMEKPEARAELLNIIRRHP
jgi:GTP cyclohydrolase I